MSTKPTKGLSLGLSVFSALVFSILVLGNSMSTTSATAEGCLDIEIVFARGSGSDFDDKEYKKFYTQITQRIETRVISLGRYELGQDKTALTSYPAVPVDGWNLFNHGLGAQISNGGGFKYGESVDKGVTELKQHLLAVSQRCPHTKFILGGYSQGAQVMGEALPAIDERSAENIVFVALFGDPKLYLPEGEGIIPPACRGEKLSDWRRAVPNCHTDDGTLGARKPYIPSSFHGRVGLWCNDKDWICGSSKNALKNSGHETYHAPGGAIDKAAFEIVRRLKEALPAYKTHAVDGSLFVRDGSDVSKLDVMYVVGANASSNDTYHAILDSVREQAQDVWSAGGRIGVVTYYNVPGASYASRPNQPMPPMPYGNSRGFINEEDQEQFWRKLAYTPNSYPIIGPRPIFYPAIFALDDPPWQLGAQKALVIISEDATYTQYGRYPLASRNTHVPYPDYLILRSIEIDPVSVYFIVGNEDNIADAEYIANGTAGKVFTYDPLDPMAVQRTIATVQQELVERPTVVFSNDTYYVDDSRSVTFDVSQSFAADGEITHYDWDYEGDGVWDATTDDSHIEHAYPDGFSEGIVHVRATDTGGRVGSMTATVETYEFPREQRIPLATGIKYKVLDTSDDNISTVRLTWDPIDTAIPYLALSVDGVHLGRIDGHRTTIDITDIHRDEAVTVDLQLMTANYDMGDRAGVIIPPLQSSSKATSPQPSAGASSTNDTPSDTDASSVSRQPLEPSLTSEKKAPSDNAGADTNQYGLLLVAGGIVIAIGVLAGGIWVAIRIHHSKGSAKNS